MTVYIEYVIIDNLILTYTIGMLSYQALKIRISRRRNAVSALVGTFFAVIFPLFRMGWAVLFCLRAMLCALLSLILFYKKSKLLISSAVFLGITFLFGGAFFALGYMFYGNVSDALLLPLVDFPIGLVILIALLIYYALKRLLKKFHKNREIKSSIYKVEIEVMGKAFEVVGFCDTGNQIIDSVTGLPVAVASFKLASKILSAESIIKIMSGSGEGSYNGARYIECKPYASKPQKLWLIKMQKFLLYFDEDKNIHIEMMLGLSLNAFSDQSYDLIFGSSVLPR